MADSIYTFDPVAANNTALDSIPYGPNQLYHNQIDNWFRALAAKLAQRVDDMGGVNTVGGTANAITVTIASGVTAYASGLLFWFKNTGGPNTTAATMNVNSIGAKEIRLQGDTALSGGEMLDNGYYGLLYDTAYDSGDGGWVLLNPEISTSISFATNAQALEASSTTLSVNPANLASLIQNINNNAFKIADLEGVRLNMAGGIADAYDSETDVDTATSTNESYDGTNDLYSPTASTTTVTGDQTVSSNALSTNTTFVNRTESIANGIVVRSLGVNLATAVTGMKLKIMLENSSTSFDIVSETATFNHPGGGLYYVDLPSDYTVPGSGTYRVGVYYPSGAAGSNSSNFSTGNRSFKSGDITGTGQTGFTAGSSGYAFAVAWKHTPTTDNMTLVSNVFTAGAVPTVARVAAFIDPQVSMTINTDFTSEVSRDGGTTWSAVTLALVSNPVGTVEQYEGTVSVSGQPSGTSMKYRHKTLNNKDIDVTGTVFQWG